LIAITVTPGRPHQAQLEERADPSPVNGELLAETLALGVCGTDREIVAGEYGWAPPGSERLVLGHEWLGRVRSAPPGAGLAPGDLVAGMVRRPDPEPCPCCERGEFDMCRNGRYRESGIKELDGFGAELVTLAPRFAIPLDRAIGARGVLTEPASVVAKAWERIDMAAVQGCRPLESVLVAGAGTIGLLAALLGAQRGLRVHVLDRVTDGPKPGLVGALGAAYHTGTIRDACGAAEPDVVVECTGVAELVVDALQSTAPGAIVCLLGVSPRGRTLRVDMGAVNNELVLENDIVFGSVNANRRHFKAAVDALASADPDWLDGMITRRVPLERWREALKPRPHDVKTVIEFAGAERQ
jgi:threonine dehydrogenase-like Zn-dependent dehydrogenase